MRKIFTFLCAALMSAGMFATTVTWDNSTLSSIYLHGGDSFTKDGVTLTVLDGMIDGRNFMGFSNDASFKFSTSLGNFTKIEITGNINALGGSGWTQTILGAVWTGEANETTFGMSFDNVSQIVFTIGEPTVAVTGVTLNQNEAQMTVGGETLTLTATVNPNNATDQSVSWSTSDGDVATVDNGVVTAVAAGNATITVTTTDGSFTATCAVTVSNPAPAEVTVVFAANNKTVERTVTLPHTFKCSWDNGMDGPDELDIIIHELYNDYYYCNSNMNASGSDQVEVGTEEAPKNDYITIKGVFEGTATVTGDYFDWITGEEGAHNYSITISIKGDEPETYTLQLVADPEKGSVAVTNLLGSDIIDNGNGNYTVPENAEVTILATPNEGFEFTGWKVGNIEEMVGCYYCGTALNTEDNPYTFTMTADVAYLAEFAADAPATMFNLAYEDKWLKVNPTDGEGQYFVFVEDKEYYDNRYMQYDQTTMQDYLDYVVGVVVGMSAQSNFVFSGEKDIDPDPIYHTWYDNDHLLINHDYVAFVFKIANDARTSDVEYLILTYEGEPEAGAVEHVALNVKKAKKVVVDGQLYIVREGKLFNVTGAEVK